MNDTVRFPPAVALVETALAEKAPMFRQTVADRAQDFGAPWVERLTQEINTSFQGDAERVGAAVAGYGRFCIEAMRLQRKFDQKLSYDQSSYADALANVYQNAAYMQDTYLPALLLSHYLWPHHFRQLQWVDEHFFASLRDAGAATFCDVGIGTGFYSKETLLAVPGIRGWGFDISDASIDHTTALLARWALSKRYTLCKKEVADELGGGFDSFISVELLEHLEDPQAFLCDLRRVVKVGALGLLTAALDAPNRDHIYLYRDNDAVREQILEAGYEVLAEENFAAYQTASAQETVPQAACFVVRAV